MGFESPKGDNNGSPKSNVKYFSSGPFIINRDFNASYSTNKSPKRLKGMSKDGSLDSIEVSQQASINHMMRSDESVQYKSI